ncbi:DNA polymerase III subunit delta' C-terminal domain-containing protein [Inmirania thermothiophila]|uniref:DNA polymerase III subunit delta' n=1 Tax=Inmirania thermothiophila TaxID=1750597 RepID=A0A3N1Y5R0_9GAMM|nr:DNA polymerase III subunit delta' C-terminal domain-containing protein [Inmirania thermothiophila]ROR32627.1 DNA polymerase III delta prime subunit [Inmirania thermothiophila]
MSAATWGPWLDAPWRRFAAAVAAGTLHHAWLVTGPDGSGKGLLAGRMVQGLLCPQGPEPCGACEDCRMAAAGVHPDLVLAAPDEPGRALRVDTVRALAARLALTARRGGRKVGVIAPAEAMNAAAANALLKTLEEPVPGTVLILVCARPGRLPATVRSRCLRLAAGPAPAALARPWLEREGGAAAAALLEAAEGAPLAARALADPEALALRDAVLADVTALARGGADPVALAARWAEGRPAERVRWLRRIGADMIRWTVSCGAVRPADDAYARRLAEAAARADVRRLWRRWAEAGRTALELEGSVNRQLALEALLLGWRPREEDDGGTA